MNLTSFTLTKMAMLLPDNWILNTVILHVLEHIVLCKQKLLILIVHFAFSIDDKAVEKHRV